jgi:methyl-accepting chemotaxis protein
MNPVRKDVIVLLENVSYSEKEFMDKLFNFINSLVIKDQKQADAGETADIARSANEYVLAQSGRDDFRTYRNYTREELVSAGVTGEDDIKNALLNPNLVPEGAKEILLRQRRKNIINSYVEKNNYYRMLNGEPDYLDEEKIMTSFGKDATKLDLREISILERTGELKALISKYPTKHYLKHLGNKRVNYYDARTAKPFYILSYGKYIFEEERAKKFIELYYQTLVYTTSVVYSDAFKHYEYYNNFITMFMVFDTMQKFINEHFNYAIRKDFFDAESIKNTFLSYGLPYFEDIPLRYQTRIVKNINELLKYKGTNKVLIDIVNLFGFTNIELFRYYLVKDFKRKEGNVLDIDFQDPRNSYELNFAQVPIDTADISSSLKKRYMYQTYEEVVADDPFWGNNDGDEDAQDEFKNKLLDAEFNYVNTKYMSMNTMLDMTKANFEACYFFNLINCLEYDGLLDQLRFFNKDIKSSGADVRVFDVVTALFCLLFKRFGYDDKVLYTPTAVGSVFGFNFESDLDYLREKIKDGATIKIGGVEKVFDINRLTPDELKVFNHDSVDVQRTALIDIFFKNRDYGQYLRDKMVKTQDYGEYKALMEIYNYNMYSDAIKDLYSTGEENVYSTYSDYLKDKDPELYEYVILNSTSRENIIKSIDTLLLSLESYFNTDKFDYIFASLTNISGELVKTYMSRILNIFKAYTVELRKINIYYVFDDKFGSMLRMFSYIQNTVDRSMAEAVLRDSIDEQQIGVYQNLIENDLKQLKEYVGRNASMVISEDGTRLSELIQNLVTSVTKADSLLMDLVDLIGVFTEIHASEIEQLKDYSEETVNMFNDISLGLERISDSNQVLQYSIEQLLAQLVDVKDYAKRESILHRVERELELKQSTNNLIIQQLFKLQLGLREGLHNSLLLMDSDLVFARNDSIVRSKTIQKDDSGIEFREAFKIY